MTIDPRWSIFLSLFLALLGVLSGAGSQFTDLGLDPKVVKAVLALVTLFIGMGNAVNAVLGAIPSKSPNSPGFYLGPSKPIDPQAKP